jgi:L-rhamnose isomerase/sugar isomerase
MGAAADPLRAYAASGYQQQIERERVGGTQMGW